MWSSSFVAIDTETSGFGPDARILEVAVVVFENGLPVHSFSRLICPPDLDWEKSAEALSVNNLTKEALVGKPTFEETLPDLMVELAHPVWVAHNMPFDFQMLAQEWARLGRTLEPPPLLLCTCRLAAFLSPMAQGNKLHQVAARYGVVQDGAHRAVVDAEVCGGIATSMVKQGKLPTDNDTMRMMMRQADVAWKRKGRRG
jgi:DNA polymerase III epsilon subunit-like protein